MASRFGDASSALNNFIKKSVVRSQGPPAVHRLYTTRSNLDEEGKIRKWTSGQKNPNTQNKAVLLVGETGTGKTTVINTMINHYLGVKFEDQVWFEITEEEKKSQTESQTSEITVYEIFSEEKPFSLTIIDTPGYGDTRGIDKDMDNPQNLYKLLIHDDGVKDLDAVCFVLKASQNRISTVQRYIFEGVLSLFGKDISNNLVLSITHSDGITPKNVLKAVEKEKIPCCHNENGPVYFLFNNIQTEIQTGTNILVLKSAWDMGNASMKSFFEFLKSRQRISLDMTVTVLQLRIQLEACVQSLKEHIEFIEAKQKELLGVQNVLKLNKEEIKKDENHGLIITAVYKEKVDITGASWWNRQATCCYECQENCHEFGCWWFSNARKCEVMKNDYCTVCHCHYNTHIKEAKKYVKRDKQQVVTFKDLKTKYSIKQETNNACVEVFWNPSGTRDEEMLETEMQNLESRLTEELDMKKEERKRSVKEAYEAIINLSKIALKPDSVCTVQYLDFLIPRVEEIGEEEWAQKLKDIQKAAANEST